MAPEPVDAVTDLERAVRALVMETLRDTSRAPARAAIARALGTSEEDVSHALQRLADAHRLVLFPGTDRVWMAHPFSAIETDFVVGIGEQRWYANCAWDGLAVLALLGDGTLSTHSPANRQPLTFEVHQGSVQGDGIVHFLVPARAFWEDIAFT